MSLNAEFILEWNKLFQFKISENDLTKPTEQFLFDALKNYLENKNINVDKILNREYEADQRKFKIKFCKYIDYLYKMSNKSNNFYYFDLIHPQRRKTLHVLTTLLNFFAYYKMVKNDVVDLANSKIKEYENIMETKSTFQSENEKAKLRAETMETKLEELDELLPKLKKQVETLKITNNNLQKQINDLEPSIKQLDINHLNLEIEKENLRSEIVLESEVVELKNSMKTIMKNIKEMEEMKRTTIQLNQELNAKINEMTQMVNKLDELARSELLVELNALKDLKIRSNDCKKQIIGFEAKNNEIKNEITVLSKCCKDTTQILKNVLNDQTHIQKKSEIQILKEKKSNEETRFKMLCTEISALTDELTERQDAHEFIVENGNVIHKQIADGID